MRSVTNLYQSAFDAIDAAVFIVDARAWTVVDATPRAVEDSGYTLEALRGLPADRLFRTQQGVGLSQALPSGSRPKPAVSELLLWLHGPTGNCHCFSVNLRWAGGDLNRHLCLTIHPAPVPAGTTCGPEADRDDFPALVGQSEHIAQVCRLIGAVAKTEATVLIQGASGTGKEVVANAIHAHSHRCRGSFVKVNCAALTEALLESELFGHVKGAFTGALRDRRGRFMQADGGTLLLDEIGCMPLAGQAKLLRVLQEHEFEPVGSSVTMKTNVRVLASTNVDLKKAVSDGSFREDLYYRLNVFEISLPQLRERKEDIPLLAQHFLNRCAYSMRKGIRDFTPETMALMHAHDWPGNVRELENAVEHAVIVEPGRLIAPASLPRNLAQAPAEPESTRHSGGLRLRERLNRVERQIILETLQHAQGIKKRAAAMLGVDPRNMPYLMKKHALTGAELSKAT